jgi:HAD superfamily hydrolase (TIGR01490 family)
VNLPRLALFDLDHTLIPFDSDYAWGEFTSGLGWTDPAEYKRQNDAFYNDYTAQTLDIHAHVRFSTAAMRQQGPKRAVEAHARYMQKIVRPRIVPAALELVAAHQRRGDMVVVVTAANAFVTRPIAQAFGVDELIAIELERDVRVGAAGWYTGEILGVPSFRDGKVTRVASWLNDHGLDWDHVHSAFYSDSINDLPLLEKVLQPVATNPDAPLRRLALERGWRILELF